MDRKILQNAIDTYGTKAQMMQCIEEMAELIQAINKYFRSSTQFKWAEAYDSVVEEIADVQIMLEQMRLLFGDKAVDEQITAKLGRLEKRLKGGAK